MLDRSEIRKLKYRAIDENVSVSELIRRAVKRQVPEGNPLRRPNE
ncbi:MAG: ribbon-helix-helix protein, CopG family [Candidatus Binatia bacterium]